MVIRRRLGGAICLIPYIIFLIIGILLKTQIIIDIAFILMFFGIIFSGTLYNLFFLNTNSTGSFYAGNMALQYGYSPKGQNGEIWNPNKCSINEIFSKYPEKRYNVPLNGTAGFLFYTKYNRNYSNQIEFYDYSLGGDSFIYYEFYFHPYDNNGDKITRREKKINEIADNMYFVPLDKI